MTAVSVVAGLPTPAVTALRQAQSAIGDCVIGRSLGSDYAGAMGVSVFSPGSTDVFARNRGDYVGLRFAKDTGWDAVLSTLYPGQSSGS